MNLMIIANRLESAGIGKKGKDIFVNMMPASVEQCVLIRQPLSGTKINHELPGYFQTSFQLIVRSHGFENGEVLAKRVVSALTISMNEKVEDHLFMYCRPKTEPVPYPLSNGNLIEFNVTFDTAFIRGM